MQRTLQHCFTLQNDIKSCDLLEPIRLEEIKMEGLLFTCTYITRLLRETGFVRQLRNDLTCS